MKYFVWLGDSEYYLLGTTMGKLYQMVDWTYMDDDCDFMQISLLSDNELIVEIP